MEIKPFRRVCTLECWIPALCSHGKPMPPAGRSIPLRDYVCCDEYSTSVNPRHLWDRHDEERFRFDPDGRAVHLSECNACREDDEYDNA